MSQQRKIKFERRNYQASSVHESLEIDIGEMPYPPKYFVCAVNIFNRMVYAQPITSKDREKVIPVVKKILKKSGDFQRVTTDLGLSFLKDMLLKRGTHLNLKVRKIFN